MSEYPVYGPDHYLGKTAASVLFKFSTMVMKDAIPSMPPSA